MKQSHFSFLLLWSKHWPKATWRLGEYVLAHIHAGLQSTESQGGNSSTTGSWGRKWSRHGGVLLTGSLNIAAPLAFFSYQQGQLYRDSTDQCELDSPTSIINQICGPRTCLQAIPQTRFLLRYVKACVKSTEPNQHRCINLDFRNKFYHMLNTDENEGHCAKWNRPVH